jgi:hypothetical protein
VLSIKNTIAHHIIVNAIFLYSSTKPNNIGLIKPESLRRYSICQQVGSEGSPALSAAEK